MGVPFNIQTERMDMEKSTSSKHTNMPKTLSRLVEAKLRLVPSKVTRLSIVTTSFLLGAVNLLLIVDGHGLDAFRDIEI